MAASGAGPATRLRDQWIDILVRTMGYEPAAPEMTERVKLLYLVRLVPLVEPNYHLIELGPRLTGKSFCFTEFSPYGTLLAGGRRFAPHGYGHATTNGSVMVGRVPWSCCLTISSGVCAKLPPNVARRWRRYCASRGGAGATISSQPPKPGHERLRNSSRGTR